MLISLFTPNVFLHLFKKKTLAMEVAQDFQGSFSRIFMAFSVLHGLAPPYLNQLVRISDLPGHHRLHSSSSQQLLVPLFQLTTVGRCSFPVAASLLWNSLPTDIHPYLFSVNA